MTEEVKETPFAKWYAKNAKALSEKRKERYRTDPAYRAKCLKARSAQLKRERVAQLEEQYVHTMRSAAEELDVTMWTLRGWKTKGYFPEPHKHGGAFYFTAAQVNLLYPLAAYTASTAEPSEAVIQNLTDLIHANWS